MSYPALSDLSELLNSTMHFVQDRIAAMQSDVETCLFDPARPAPFSALLYCFATIDLMGALSGGDAKGNTTAQARSYMTTFMRYPEDRVRLLQSQFRHKIVHLAQPKPVISDGMRFIAWELHHDEPHLHLRVDPVPANSYAMVGPSLCPQWKIECTHVFRVSVRKFSEDIKNSAVGVDSYMVRLPSVQLLQDNARKALKSILEP